MSHFHIQRNHKNPIITVKDVAPSMEGYEVIGVFNAGAVKYNGRYLLLLRVAERPVQTRDNVFLCPVYQEEADRIDLLVIDKQSREYDFSDLRVIKGKDGRRYLSSISHVRLAWSQDGTHFEVEDKPFIKAYNKYTAFGVEDPRVSRINGRYYISFTGVSDNGIVCGLWSTDDFVGHQDHGIIFHPDNKDVTLFPDVIDGKYYALHRQSTSEFDAPNIWISTSDNLVHWGDHRILAKVRPGTWESQRVGGGAAPFLTRKGWLEIYHGADEKNRYCLGLILLDSKEPWKVITRYELPILEPEADHEMVGFFGNVIFSCGAILEEDIVRIYYGASDESICEASVKLEDLLALV